MLVIVLLASEKNLRGSSETRRRRTGEVAVDGHVERQSCVQRAGWEEIRRSAAEQQAVEASDWPSRRGRMWDAMMSVWREEKVVAEEME